MGQMRVPSNFKVSMKETYEVCKQQLKLDWVNGYRGYDTHQSLYSTQVPVTSRPLGTRGA
eukprot:4471587-Pyramimonas_sp.AAC.3